MPRVPRTVLVAVLAAASLAEDVDHVDVSSLLQYSANISLHSARVVGPSSECQCLNWKETYSSGMAHCGSGFEFTRYLGYPVASYPTPEAWLKRVGDRSQLVRLQGMMGAEFCDSFYRIFDDTKCARAAMDSSPTEWWGRSWCYVSPKCETAMPTSGAKASVKFCEEGKDSLLSDMDPEALVAYGEKMGFYVPGYFVKVSYPVDRGLYYNSAAPEQIAALKASGETVLVDAVDEHKDQMIIQGGKVYVMPGLYEGFRCVEGCK